MCHLATATACSTSPGLCRPSAPAASENQNVNISDVRRYSPLGLARNRFCFQCPYGFGVHLPCVLAVGHSGAVKLIAAGSVNVRLSYLADGIFCRVGRALNCPDPGYDFVRRSIAVKAKFPRRLIRQQIGLVQRRTLLLGLVCTGHVVGVGLPGNRLQLYPARVSWDSVLDKSSSPFTLPRRTDRRRNTMPWRSCPPMLACPPATC